MKRPNLLSNIWKELTFRCKFSIGLALALLALYWWRPYFSEGITIWPSWLWLFPGVLLCWRKKFSLLWKTIRWPLLVWILVALLSSEIWRVVLFVHPPAEVSNQSLRVVSFNMAGRMEDGLAEVARVNPDIVLVQESAQMTRELSVIESTLGEGFVMVEAVDCTVFLKGTLTYSDTSATNHTIVKAEIKGKSVLIVNIRMQPIWPRLDYWTLDCWKSYSDHRRSHESELAEIWSEVQKVDEGELIVFGGDFNAIPDKSYQSVFDNVLEDSFKSKGRGWYGTALNEIPFFRIDQIWYGGGLQASHSRSYSSEVSDHRYVVADFEFSKR